MGRVLIVGGGIGGLSLATALQRRGCAAELVERSPAWPALGAGIALHANGVRMLRGLGLGEAIDHASAVLRRWSFHDEQGTTLCETDLEALWGRWAPVWASRGSGSRRSCWPAPPRCRTAWVWPSRR